MIQFVLFPCNTILYITYCVEIWGNTHKTNTNPIFKSYFKRAKKELYQ